MSNPPAPDEFEISIFGPGIGECVVLHLGHGEWMVVDSCIDADTKEPVALQFLKSMGVDPAKAVRLVVVTHWHDDHFRGAAATLEAATAARFACSGALSQRDFFTVVAAGQRLKLRAQGATDLAEFDEIFRILKRRAPTGSRATSIGPEWAFADRALFVRGLTQADGAVEVHALSPSSATQTRAVHEIATLLATLVPGKARRRPVAQSANQLAVALWVRVGGIRALLGADLEATTNPMVGWTAIVNSTTRPQGSAQIIKVPHHGSRDADEPQVWSSMLDSSPVALLTPFAGGSSSLPSEADVARLKGRTSQLYCTASPRGRTPPKRDRAVEKTMNEVARRRRTRVGRLGHVQVRWRIGAPYGSAPTIRTLNGAAQL